MKEGMLSILNGGKILIFDATFHTPCHTIELVDFLPGERSNGPVNFNGKYRWFSLSLPRVIGYASLCSKNLSEIADISILFYLIER